MPNLTGHLVLTTSRKRYMECKAEGYEVESYAKYLGISDNIETLYTIFNYFFKCDKIDDVTMMFVLFEAFINNKKPKVYCVWVDNTVCYFKIDNGIKILGEMSISEPISKFSVGEFYRELRYRLVCSDFSLNNVYHLCYGRPFCSDYIGSYVDLRLMFSFIEGLKGLSLPKIVERLSSRIYLTTTIVTAKSLVESLRDSYISLGIKESGNKLSTRYAYYKDYTVCNYDILTKYRDCEYGFIIDCEGVSGGNGALQNGCRQVGVVIYVEYKGRFGMLDKYVFDGELLTESLIELPNTFKDVTGRNIPRGGIPTYIYGTSDKIMIESQINSADKKTSKQLKGKFKFIDVKFEINKVLDSKGMTAKRTLQNIARELGVYAVRPKHNALADAKTLFNILSEIKKGANYE